MAAAVSSSLPSVEQSLYVVRVDDVGSVLESDEESVHELLQGGGSLPVESRSSKLFVLIVIWTLLEIARKICRHLGRDWRWLSITGVNSSTMFF